MGDPSAAVASGVFGVDGRDGVLAAELIRTPDALRAKGLFKADGEVTPPVGGDETRASGVFWVDGRDGLLVVEWMRIPDALRVKGLFKADGELTPDALVGLRVTGVVRTGEDPPSGMVWLPEPSNVFLVREDADDLTDLGANGLPRTEVPLTKTDEA